MKSTVRIEDDDTICRLPTNLMFGDSEDHNLISGIRYDRLRGQAGDANVSTVA